MTPGQRSFVISVVVPDPISEFFIWHKNTIALQYQTSTLDMRVLVFYYEGVSKTTSSKEKGGAYELNKI